MSKPRVIKDFDKLEAQIQRKLKLMYPYGFEKDLISFKNHKNKFVSALPFETEDMYYLVRMTKEQANAIVMKDTDYDDQGNLKDEAKTKLKESIEKGPTTKKNQTKPKASTKKAPSPKNTRAKSKAPTKKAPTTKKK